MGTCILMPTNVGVDTQNALAGLGKWQLERDDSNTEYPHRIYRDNKSNIYISVTHILGQTAPQEQKDALERWLNRPNSYEERDMAAKRGTFAHAHAEYILKTTAKLALEAIAWNVHHQRSRHGQCKRPSAMHQKSTFPLVATPEVYGLL